MNTKADPTEVAEIKKDTSDVSTVILPTQFLKCSRSDLIVLISRMLVFLIQINDTHENHEEQANGASETILTRFHSSTPPNISIYNYLLRLTKYSALEASVLLTSVYYIDLLSSIYPAFTLNSLTAHRFLLTATSVASKGLCDSFCTNAHYAKVGGVQCSELNILEEEFLRKVKYRVIPRDDNITLCKLEHQQKEFTVPDTNVIGTVLPPTVSLENSGYNVLDMYYKKMIQLVGSYSSSPDKTRKVNYKLEQPTILSTETDPPHSLYDHPTTLHDRSASKRPYDISNEKYADNSAFGQTVSGNQKKKHVTQDIREQNHSQER
ncbi:Pho80 protein [Maudiozyma humilis]|uniref:Pho80 protein n=1 Tax=Maudiozyma humilis TaxID=51915 RepID=A0AAV5RUD8_MAUHU|nr:Pho80 protein [Kazachstania humilis]